MAQDKKSKGKTNGGVSIRVVGMLTIVVAIALAFFAFALAGRVSETETNIAADEKNYTECSSAVAKLQQASDYLTMQARMFVVTGDRTYLDAYIHEISISKQRDQAVDKLQSHAADNPDAIAELEQALDASNGLAQSELAAMRLAAEHYQTTDLPQEISNASLAMFRSTPDDASKLDVAKGLVLNENYNSAKDVISSNVQASADALLTELNTSLEEGESLMQELLFQLRIAVALLLCVIMILVLALFMYVLKPLTRYVESLNENDPLKPNGAYELRYLANAYNVIYEDNSQHIEQLRENAERDPLTGISNRAGYDSFLSTHTRNIALLLIDVDNFKEFTTVYGHDMGDAVLVRLAEALVTAFRLTDFPCRIDGDLFAVIMTNMNTELRFAILNKIKLVNQILADEDDLPTVTISVGAAFSTEGMDDRDIYRAADSALSKAKKTQSGSVVFYGEDYAVEE